MEVRYHNWTKEQLPRSHARGVNDSLGMEWKHSHTTEVPILILSPHFSLSPKQEELSVPATSLSVQGEGLLDTSDTAPPT